MPLHHLHLNVRDRARSERFYGQWFDLTVDRRTDALSFLLDAHDFLLVLQEDASPAPLPDWFHFGFPQVDGAAVLSLHNRMVAADVPLCRAYSVQPDITAFRVRDPDGHPVEVYWLPAGHRSISRRPGAL